MQLIEDNYFGQIFITDTDKNRVTKKAIETTNLTYKILRNWLISKYAEIYFYNHSYLSTIYVL